MENVLIQTRLIEGSYPETSRLIPQNFNYELVVDARDILSAIDRASFIKNEGVSIIKMDISASEIVITSRSSEVGSVETITPGIPNAFPKSIEKKTFNTAEIILMY